MSGEQLRDHAEHFLAAALRHPECRDGRFIEISDSGASIELDINVEMPLHMRVDDVSLNGVRKTETVIAKLTSQYPWSSPAFYLRDDFPRNLPHLQPGTVTEPPRPCLIDANQREYFFQFGLVEIGVFYLVHQLVLWLQHAAIGALIDPKQGWEPTLRRDLSDVVVISAEACRAMVDRRGGHRVLKARCFRSGADNAKIGGEAAAWLAVTGDQTPLSRHDRELFTSLPTEHGARGSSVCCVVWPDKLPNGQAFVADAYMPETINTFAGLIQRSAELGCERALRVFLGSLEQCFQRSFLEAPIPIAVVFCARRPLNLIGSDSPIELLPYVLEIRAMRGRQSLFAGGDDEPVAPAMQLDATNPALLRKVSGAPEVPPVAMLGCGSLGSKMAMHLARSGVEIVVVSDKDTLRPHNMARHALARPPVAPSKSEELANELGHLGQSPRVHTRDLVPDLASKEGYKTILPKHAGYAVNTTASLAVREALSVLPEKRVKTRLAEAALFGRGQGGFLLIEGADRNPTLCDLIAELYSTVPSGRLRDLLFDPAFGLTEIQIGQGCGSLTMPMTDMRLSAMTAALTEQLVGALETKDDDGQIVIGNTATRTLDTSWSRQTVAPFEVVNIEVADGWTLRISQRVLEEIRAEIARHPTVETGGVMIGTCSARLRAVTVVDLIPAPPDSIRTARRFVLGTEGLKDAILSRHAASGSTLFDVGTWHSHLTDHGPSALDRKTAEELAAERPPPSALLIATPNRFYALMHSGAVA